MMHLLRFVALVMAWTFSFGLAMADELDAPVPRDVYTQAGFNAGPAAREFADWQKRFEADWEKMYGKAKPSNKDELLEQAPGLFSNSIETSKKGLSLKSYLVKAVYAGDARTAHAGVLAKRMMLSKSAKPVGFGGTYEQDGYTIEIWYMALHDLGKMSQEDFRSAAAYSVFEKLELPKLNEGTRGTWPILLFVRNKSRQLMLYGHSKEMFDISEKAERKQYY